MRLGTVSSSASFRNWRKHLFSPKGPHCNSSASDAGKPGVSYLSVYRGSVNFKDSISSRRVGSSMIARPESQRIVITGVGLTAPNGNTLPEFRDSLLAGRSGVRKYEIRYVGDDAGRRLRLRRAALPERRRKSAAARGPAASASTAPTRRSPTPGSIGPNVDTLDRRRLRRRHRARQRRDRERNLSSSRATTTTRSSGRTTTTRGRWPTTRPARSR